MDISGKHVLLDTNILIFISKNPVQAERFLSELENINCVPVITNIVAYEILCGARSRTERANLKNFISGFTVLPSQSDDYLQVAELFNLYLAQKPDLKKQISYADCYNAYQMIKYGENLILITADLNDVPVKIFDRIHAAVIDSGDNVITLGYYKFSAQKYQKVSEAFEKAKQ